MVASANQAEGIAAFDADGLGRVRWQGLSWAALNLDSAQELAIGQRVSVIGREGTRLQGLCRQLPSSLAPGSRLERRDQQVA